MSDRPLQISTEILFQNLAEARRIIGEFITWYNTEWLIERLGHQTPVAARTAALAA